MKTWYIPDCYWNSKSNGTSVSHEAVCVLNTNNTDAHLEITLYFQDRDPIDGFSVDVPKQRTLHIRLDKIKNKEGICVPTDTPYALTVKSDQENLFIQYTRVDSSQEALSLCTTII